MYVRMYIHTYIMYTTYLRYIIYSDATPTTNQTKQLLSAALLHVPDLGWSEETLNAGARDINLSLSEISCLAPHGPIDLVHHFIRQSKESLSTDPSVLKYLQDNKEPNTDKDPPQDTNNDSGYHSGYRARRSEQRSAETS